jgi:hypothetical protein
MRFASACRPHGFPFGWAISLVLILGLLANNTAFAGRVLLDAVSAKQALTKRGIGKFVRVTESDGTSITGILTAIHDDNFEVTPRRSTTPATIAYAQVTEVHNDKSRTSHPRNRQGVEIAAGVIVVAAVIGAVIYFVTHFHPSGEI